MRSMARWGTVLVGAGLLGGGALLNCVGDSPVGPGLDAGTDVTTPADASGTDSGGGDAGGCSARAVDDAKGIYVSINGADSPTCGARTAPCQTIQSGVNQAKLLGRSTVYIARGTFKESVTMAPGVTLEGGWDTLSAQWVPICGSDEISAVKIVMPDAESKVITADFKGATGLRLLSVLGKATVAPGESVYGVLAHDATVTLDSVVVNVGDAGAGSDADAGATGASGGVKCAESTGAAGKAAKDGTGAPAGTFGANGYVLSDGTAGASDGGTGTAGACNITPSCFTVCNTCTKDCVKDLAGCGGGPGSGGGGGTGGGSSIAVYGWNATFTLVGGSYTAGNGGNGGNGGAGGPGGTGGAGSNEQELCLSSCDQNGCASVGDQTLAAGNTGGAGGPGGAGGGGAGGFSYAVFNGGDAGAVTTQNAPTFVHGTAGTGGSLGGATGLAGDKGP